VVLEKLPFIHRRISPDEQTLPFAGSRGVVMSSRMDGYAQVQRNPMRQAWEYIMVDAYNDPTKLKES
jgi:hypothetical protein